MNPGKTIIEASADLDIPDRIWRAVTGGATHIANQLWPEGTVGLRAVNEDDIRRMNLHYRDVNEVTDVLSFPAAAGHYIGDIALCWPFARRQADSNSNSIEAEALALVCHGLLHLAGYTHDTDDSDNEMNRLTRKLCKSAGVEVLTFGH